MKKLKIGTPVLCLDFTDGIIQSGRVNFCYIENIYDIILEGIEYNSHRTKVFGASFFLTKKEAVKEMIAATDKEIAFHKEMIAKFEKRKEYFSDKNFQMRYMGEVLE